MRLSVIIVSYNTKNITFKCLQTLYRAKGQLDLEVFVVDNASADGSPEYLSQAFPQVKVLANKDNLGFGPANNQAAKLATGEYLFFLNSDTEIIGDSLQQLMALAQKHQSPLATCRLINRDRSLQPQGGAIPNLFNLFAWMLFIDDLPLVKNFFPAYQRRHPAFFLKDQHPGWIGGTAMLVKTDIFRALGGFHPDIFMYGEDIDLCYRAHRQGYRIDYFATPQILHLGQASSSSKNAIAGEVKGLKFFYHNYRPAWQLPVIRLFMRIGFMLRIVIFGMIGRYEAKAVYREVFHLV